MITRSFKALTLIFASSLSLDISWSRPRIKEPNFWGFANNDSQFLSVYKLSYLSVCDNMLLYIFPGHSLTYKWIFESLVSERKLPPVNFEDLVELSDMLTATFDGETWRAVENNSTVADFENSTLNSDSLNSQKFLMEITSNHCAVNWTAPREGSFKVKLEAIYRNRVVASGTKDFFVKDFWFVVFGDSYVSGQGNPNLKQNMLGIVKPVWLDGECYRSVFAFPFLLYKKLTKHYPNHGILFTFLACSGATIPRGLVGRQKEKDAQIEVVLNIQSKMLKSCCKLKPDLILFGIGGNDIGFARLVATVLAGNPGGALENVERKLIELEQNYELMNFKLSKINISSSRIFYIEYFDLLRNEHGEIDGNCAGIGFATSKLYQFADEIAREPLNRLIKYACERFHWMLIDGVDELFYTHGTCAKKTFIRSLKESLELQIDFNGAFHPNIMGHRILADHIWKNYFDGFFRDIASF